MRVFLTAVLAALPALSCGKKESLDGKAWKADYAVSAKLGEENEAAPFRLRLPPGFRPAPVPALAERLPEDSRILVWKGDSRAADRSMASLLFLVTPMTIHGPKAELMDDVMPTVIDRLRAQFEDVVTGAPEKGTIDGIPFRRIHWTGKETKRNVRVGGVVYYGLDRDHLVQLWALDAEAHLPESLPLGEASILSLRRP